MFPIPDMLFAAGVALAVFVATVLTGLIGLPIIRRGSSEQPIRHNGPRTHLAKAGTPTFGGLFFLLPFALVAIAGPLLRKDLTHMSVALLLMFLFAAVGFMDDFIKVRVSPKGLSVRQKTLLLGLLSIVGAVYYLWLSPVPPFILVPFTVEPIFVTGWWKALYLVFLVPFFFYMSNSINITDGVDGLLSSLMSIACLGLFTVGGLLFAILPGEVAGSFTTLSAVLAAGCLGFLLFNRYPAKIFMGDTGSQALGIGFVFLTVMAGVPYLALITGFVFFFEGFSVVLQVLYFKHTGGKRIFRMSPIHHHFELGGWKEMKIVNVFSLIAFLAAILGFSLVSGPLFRR